MSRPKWYHIGYDHEAYCLSCPWEETRDLDRSGIKDREVLEQHVLNHYHETGHPAVIREMRVFTPHPEFKEENQNEIVISNEVRKV